MPEPLRIGSLFSGIGGLELGLERGLAVAGVPTRTLFQVEQNKYCRQILARHWPHAQRFEDVRDITAATVPPIDLLAGGFPCQDLSYAGKGAGLAGERSGLFFEMARIIRELVPRVVVMENVPAINSRGLDVVLGALASCRYAARWGMLRADDPLVGAPHRRERWFCVAWLADSSGSDIRSVPGGIRRPTQAAENHLPERQRRGAAAGCGSAAGMANSIGHRLQGQLQTRSATRAAHRADRAGEWWQTESGMGGRPHGIPRKLDAYRWPAPPGPQHPWEPPRTRPREKHDRDRLKALGNAVVPACAEIIGRWIGSELVGLR